MFRPCDPCHTDHFYSYRKEWEVHWAAVGLLLRGSMNSIKFWLRWDYTELVKLI